MISRLYYEYEILQIKPSILTSLSGEVSVAVACRHGLLINPVEIFLLFDNRASLIGRSTEQKTCDLAGEQFKNAKENIKRGFKETGNSLYGMSTYHLLDGNGSTKRSMT